MSDLFPASPDRLDPYSSYAFQVFLAGNTAPVAAVSGVGPVRRYTDVIDRVAQPGPPAGAPVFVYRCWVSEYQALPFLDAGTPATAFERITVENEGWERDTSLAEPQEQ